jgi:GAF domain-containing protein
MVHDITERKKMEEDIERNEARLESLLRLSQRRAGSIQEILDFALEEAICLTSSKIGYIYYYDETKKEFTLNSWSKEVMNQCSIVEQQTVYQLEKTGIWGEAVRQAKPIVVNDFHAPDPLKKGYPEGHSPLHRFMTVPVVVEGRIVGVVGVANKKSDYNDTDVRQLTLLLDSAWRIAERKRVEENLRATNEELTRFNKTMVDRELRMVELKKEVNGLCAQAGQTLRYPLDWEKTP